MASAFLFHGVTIGSDFYEVDYNLSWLNLTYQCGKSILVIFYLISNLRLF